VKAIKTIAVATAGFPVVVLGLVLAGAGADASNPMAGSVVSGLNLAAMPAAGR